jgi:hypothetical protein
VRWLVAVVVLVGTAHAQPSSPGPLVPSHAQLACVACHPQRTAAVGCAGCHDALVQRSLHATFQGRACTTCHLDHEGAAFDIQNWRSIGVFDHAKTSWRLTGQHATTACVRCHTGTFASGRTRFGGLSTTCGACHQANPHRFAGPEFQRCDRCHTETAWKPVKATMEFDHDRDTKMPLVGAHQRACVDCHPRNEFATTKLDCTGCHETPTHDSPMFDQRPCEQCHSPALQKFAVFHFDHDATKFPLLGPRHRIGCERCHTQKLASALPPMKCEGCHLEPSPHGKRFAKVSGGCAACHTGSTWTRIAAFAHGKQTKFALVGKHSQIKCDACHRGATFERVQTGCKECHAHATVHADADHPKGKFTTAQCSGCHTNNFHEPRPVLSVFHGPQSQFPLVQGHKNVPCTECHTGRTTRGKTAFDGVSMECGPTCHADSSHAGALGVKCTRCHVSGVWTAAKLDHAAYPLEGLHVDAPCAACHGTDKKFKGTPRRCGDAACHGPDDAHNGALGTSCDRCHLTNGDNRFSHTISAKFKLDGKHLTVPCRDCHPSSDFKPRPMSCFGCHPDPRAHFGKYGTRCERCHTTNAWR